MYYRVTINGFRELRFFDKIEAESFASYWGEKAVEVIGDINLWRI